MLKTNGWQIAFYTLLTPFFGSRRRLVKRSDYQKRLCIFTKIQQPLTTGRTPQKIHSRFAIPYPLASLAHSTQVLKIVSGENQLLTIEILNILKFS